MTLDQLLIEKLARSIDGAFVSPNCLDSNLEPANVVDALYEIADAVRWAASIQGAFAVYDGMRDGPMTAALLKQLAEQVRRA